MTKIKNSFGKSKPFSTKIKDAAKSWLIRVLIFCVALSSCTSIKRANREAENRYYKNLLKQSQSERDALKADRLWEKGGSKDERK